jgi:hypothetical protein
MSIRKGALWSLTLAVSALQSGLQFILGRTRSAMSHNRCDLRREGLRTPGGLAPLKLVRK